MRFVDENTNKQVKKTRRRYSIISYYQHIHELYKTIHFGHNTDTKFNANNNKKKHERTNEHFLSEIGKTA